MRKGKKTFVVIAIIALCAAISAGSILVKKHRYNRLMQDVSNAISQDSRSTATEDSAEEYPLYVVTGDDFVSMYQTASTDAEEVNQVYPGSIVEYMGDAADGFAYIRGKGSTVSGYVKKEYLKESDFVYSLSPLTIVDTDTSTYSYEEMQNDIKQLDEKYEALSYSSVGQTLDSREIYKLTIGSGPNKMLFYGAVNGTDYMTSQLLMKQAEYYAHYFDEGIFDGHKYSELFSNVRIEIIPMVNPDGVSISQWDADIIVDEELHKTVKDMFYSDRSSGYTDKVKTVYYTDWKANASGIDLSLNFPDEFDVASSLKGVSHKGYKGTSALSEPESSALASVIKNGNYSAVIGYTAEGGCVTFVDDMENEDMSEQSQIFAEGVSSFVKYPLNGDSTSFSRSGTPLLYSTLLGIPSVEIGISSEKAPLPIDALQEPWIKLRELPALIAQQLL